MAFLRETHSFPSMLLGSKREIVVLKFGEKTGKKTYIQANLHADEAPGVLVLFHLEKMLKEADKRGDVDGEIVIVPSANPIGQSQWNHGRIDGRFDNKTGVNFNRDFPDVTEEVAELISGKLSSDEETNISLIRSAISTVIKGIETVNESEYLKKYLYSLAYDSDIVLDLHCDFDGISHIYLGTPLWETSKDLSKQMGAKATLLSRSSGGDPFDEACGKTYWELAEKFPKHPIPLACLSATIELRGRCDVTHEIAKKDAKNIFIFLQRRGFIKGQYPDLPELKNEATPLEGVQQIQSNNSGIIVYHKESGDSVEKGDLIAEIINPLDDEVSIVKSETSGILFTRRSNRLATNGLIIGRVAGKEVLKGKGKFLLSP